MLIDTGHIATSIQHRDMRESSAGSLILIVCLCLISITIPLSNNLNSYAIVLFCIVSLFQTSSKEKLSLLKKNRFWIIPAAYFVWLVITSLLNTEYIFSIKHVEGYATFLFLPIVFTCIPLLTRKQVYVTCLFFISTVLIITIICLTKSYHEYVLTKDDRVFNYHYLSMQVGLNAIFLSNYCVASILWILYSVLFDLRKRSLPIIFGCLLVVGYLVFIVFLLSSKMVIALMLIQLIAVFALYGYRQRKLRTSLVLILVLLSVSAIAISKISYLNWRLRVTELKQYEGTIDDQNGLAARLLMWESASDVISRKPLIGHGVKGAKEQLVDEYKQRNFQIAYQNRYHSHNQFLETMLMGGVVALALFLLMLFLIARTALYSRNLLLLLLLFHYMMVSMVESTLEVQQELVFFFFFMFLFFSYSHQKKSASRAI